MFTTCTSPASPFSWAAAGAALGRPHDPNLFTTEKSAAQDWNVQVSSGIDYSLVIFYIAIKNKFEEVNQLEMGCVQQS